MKNLPGIIAVAAVVLQLVSHCVQAEDVVSDKESLRGIKLIGVTVGNISDTAKKMGINKNSLRKYTELIYGQRVLLSPITMNCMLIQQYRLYRLVFTLATPSQAICIP